MTDKHTSESGHWYTEEGEPKYTIIGANGKERNTTLADARKRKLSSRVYPPPLLEAAPTSNIMQLLEFDLARRDLSRQT